ncbi:MAG: hypothetical protein ACPGLY_26675 [Rubripirellula sp.]
MNWRWRSEKGSGCVAPTIRAPTITATTITATTITATTITATTIAATTIAAPITDESEVKLWPFRGPHHRVENVMPMVG